MTLEEYLKSRGIDLAKCSPEELAFAKKMHGVETKNDPPPLTEFKDCTGALCKVGDLVTLVPLKVTGVHFRAGDPNHGIEDRVELNLARVTDKGEELHLFTLNAKLVTKSTTPAKAK